MDKFKSAMHRHIGCGGMKCTCCNPERGKGTKKTRILRKRARAFLKRETATYIGTWYGQRMA
jgi:hypothetical protein